MTKTCFVVQLLSLKHLFEDLFLLSSVLNFFLAIGFVQVQSVFFLLTVLIQLLIEQILMHVVVEHFDEVGPSSICTHEQVSPELVVLGAYVHELSCF